MNNKSFFMRILIVIAVIILIVGLIWVGFAAVKMVDKWIGRQAAAQTAEKAMGGITDMLPFRAGK